MKQDIRDTDTYRDAEALWRILRCPGEGQFSDAMELDTAADQRRAAFAGTVIEQLAGSLPTRICDVDLESGQTRVLTYGPNTDRLPKYSPDGRAIAFLSDRGEEGNFQLYLMDAAGGDPTPTPYVGGWVEYLHWSPDGTRILMGVAAHGADLAGTQGAVTSNPPKLELPAWIPSVGLGDEDAGGRSVWLYERARNCVRRLDQIQANVWEAAWCGSTQIAFIGSAGPAETDWYCARLYLTHIETGETMELYTPEEQLGVLSASPQGTYIAVVEALCSDRNLIAGNLLLIEARSRAVHRPGTNDASITTTQWRSERTMLLAGLRGFETIVGTFDTASGHYTEAWASEEISTAGSAIGVAGLGSAGDCVLVGEGFMRAPELAVIRCGRYQVVRSFDLGYASAAQCMASVERIRWDAQDGLEVQGWLLRPNAAKPHPLVLNVHGGPVSNWRPAWLGRQRTVPMLMMLQRGYAILLPNPRGSSGRGQVFARGVLGDIGGTDASDCLAGIDWLLARNLVDRARIGVMGVSYGGFLTATLIARDSRFAAAVLVAPFTNLVTQHLLSNISGFVRKFTADTFSNSSGRYFGRSPLLRADCVVAPSLNICGALDRCTPAEEAAQFHSALRERGIPSVLVTYPLEGHGVRKLPAAIDYAARVVCWFEEYMGADGAATQPGRLGA